MANHRKTIAQKKLEGTYRADRDKENHLTFHPLQNLPEWIGGHEYANAYYQRIGMLLISNNLLTEADLVSLQRAATWFYIYLDARLSIISGGYIQRAQSGYNNVSGHLTAFEKAHKYLTEFEAKFGLDPLSREKLSIKITEDAPSY